MMTSKRQGNNAEGHATWIGILVMLVFAVFMLYKGISDLRFSNTYKKVWGEYLYNEYRTIDDEREYRAKFKYQVDGSVYYMWSEYDSKWEKPQAEVLIYYNPEKPAEARTKVGRGDAWMLISLGITCALFTVGFLIVKLVDNNLYLCELVFGLGFMVLGIFMPVMTIKEYGLHMAFMFVIGICGAILAGHGFLVLIGVKDKNHELNIFAPLVNKLNKN